MAEADLSTVLWATGRPLELAQRVLDEHGIPWSVMDEGDRGYRLSVPAERADEAQRVLRATESRRLLKWLLPFWK